jgi:VirK protein
MCENRHFWQLYQAAGDRFGSCLLSLHTRIKTDRFGTRFVSNTAYCSGKWGTISMLLRVFRFGIFLVVASSCAVRIAEAADNNPRYMQLEKAIMDGKDIRITLNLAACFVHGTAKPGPSIRGSLHFEGYMIEPDRSIAFAETHFTVKPDNKPVDEFLSFRVQPSGKVSARSRFLNAATYEIFHDEEFDCSLGEGTTFHW